MTDQGIRYIATAIENIGCVWGFCWFLAKFFQAMWSNR